MLGNAVRALVSPQCWRRVLRLNVEHWLDEHTVRTRSIPPRLARTLRTAGWPADLAAFAGTQMAACAGGDGLKTDPRENHRTLAMVLLPDGVMHDLAALCEQHRSALEEAAAAQAAESTGDSDQQSADGQTDGESDENTDGKTGSNKGSKKKPSVPKVLPQQAVNALLTGRTISINLFGRMLAGIPGGAVDGAVDLAPAFTVHAADAQPDFFTAVEDWPEPGAAGSAHLQTAFFTTGVFYRYTAVNVTQLAHNLAEDPARLHDVLELFAEEFLTSLPRAKHTSTAPHTLPYLVHYAVRDSRPLSYADAFERPVAATHGGGYTVPARQQLCRHATAMTRLAGTRWRIAHGHAHTDDLPLDGLGPLHPSYADLITAAATAAISAPGPTADSAADSTAGGGRPFGHGLATSTGGHRPVRHATHISHRDYLAGAAFTLAVQGPDALLERLATCLRRPCFAPYLGRRACVPDEPLVLRGPTPDALTHLHARVPLTLPRPPRPGQDTVPVDFLHEHPPVPDAIAQHELADVPEDLAPTRRRHRLRPVWRTTEHLPAALYAGEQPVDRLIDYVLEDTP